METVLSVFYADKPRAGGAGAAHRPEIMRSGHLHYPRPPAGAIHPLPPGSWIKSFLTCRFTIISTIFPITLYRGLTGTFLK